MDTRWVRLYREAAERQHGAVALRQAVACGIAVATFHRHVRRHGWTRLQHGVWAVPGSPDTYERRCWAAHLAVPRSVLTAESLLWQQGVLRAEPRRVGLWVPPPVHPTVRAGVRIHRGRWVAGDRVTAEDGLPGTPVLRALTDFAADHPVHQVGRAIAAMDRLRHATPASVRAYLRRRERFPGRRGLVSALVSIEGELTHSKGESFARTLLRGVDLPWQPHPRPLRIEIDGAYCAEIDLAWPPVRYGLEVDGPHHLLPEVAAADRDRDRRLGRLHWTVDRFFIDDMMADQAGFVEQVRRGLAAAAERGVAPGRASAALRPAVVNLARMCAYGTIGGVGGRRTHDPAVGSYTAGQVVRSKA